MCGDGVMATQLAFQLEDNGSIPISPLQFSFDVIRAQTACDLNAKWHSRFPEIHWSNVVRNKHYICYGAFFEGHCFAVAIWSSPIAANRLKNGQLLLELRRMAISQDCPKNTASRMLSFMRKDVYKRFPDVIKLISYQDTEAHVGTIYKASGWVMAEGQSNLDWNTSTRKRNKAQSNAPKIRWEYNLREAK